MIKRLVIPAHRASTVTTAWRAHSALVALNRMAQSGLMSGGREPQAASSVLTRTQAYTAACVKYVPTVGRLMSNALPARSARRGMQAWVASACHAGRVQHQIPPTSFATYAKLVTWVSMESVSRVVMVTLRMTKESTVTAVRSGRQAGAEYVFLVRMGNKPVAREPHAWPVAKVTLGQLVSALSVPVGVLPTTTLRRVSRATAVAVAWMGCALCAPPVHSRTVTIPLVIHAVQGK